jgi:cytochrome c
MRQRRPLVSVLVVAAIGSAAWLWPHQARAGGGAGAAVNLQTPVPAAVTSLLQRSCLDCHSDATRWPWYAAVPLVSHLVKRDVMEGRRQLNLSRWTQYNPFTRADLLDHMCDKATRGEMPPFPYRLVHRDARPSAGDVAAFCSWTRDEAARLVQEEK